MLEIIQFFLYFIWFLFWIYVGSVIFRVIKRQSDLKKESMEEVEVRHIPVFMTETHNGIIYAFDTINDNFISQGSSLDEVADIAYKYKKVDLALVTYDNQNFWFINGKTTPVNARVI